MCGRISVNSFDAVALLGYGEAGSVPLPKAAPGDIIFRYGGWSLVGLRDSPVGRMLMHRQAWYEVYPWGREGVIPGLYRLRIPVPGTNGNRFVRQLQMLDHAESVAPDVLIVTALLCLHLLGEGNPIGNGSLRCAGGTVCGGRPTGVHWVGGAVSVFSDQRDVMSDHVWLSSAQAL